MTLCAVETCGRRSLSRGWCNSHYERWRLHGDVQAQEPIGRRRSVCRCGQLVHGAGMCNLHYRRWRATGDPGWDVPGKMRAGGPCDIDGCVRTAKRRGMCAPHYATAYQTGHRPPPVSREPCPVCGGDVDRSRRVERRYCSPQCRYSALSGRPNWRVLLRRDGATCHICGREVEPSLPARSAQAPTVDHIVPRSKGGSDDLSNLRLAHLSCNVRRGNRVLVPSTHTEESGRG